MEIVPVLIASLFLATAAQTAAMSPHAAVCGSAISHVSTADRPGLCPRPLGTTLIAHARHVART